MHPVFRETIAALATPPHNAALAVIRISGPNALALLRRLFFSASLIQLSEYTPRRFYFGKILSRKGALLDEALAVYFKAPHSFTGEDVVEFHIHGNVFLTRKILREIFSHSEELNVRAAEPGEFSKRAFLNGKMDLTKAEAVHDIISAESEAALNANLLNLNGHLNVIVSDLRDRLKTAQALIEASFEFPDEDIQTFDRNELFDLLQTVLTSLKNLSTVRFTSQIVDQGVPVAIVGKPNVGKSSLLNALLVENRAIVTDIPGTTRDVVEGALHINQVRFVFRDTAGIRETADVVEKAGIARSREWIKKSRIILWVHDCPNEIVEDNPYDFSSQQTVIKLLNKADLFGDKQSGVTTFDLNVSAHTGSGLEKLKELIYNSAGLGELQQEPLVHINERQFIHIERALCALGELLTKQTNATFSEEYLAEDLMIIIRELEMVTGVITKDDVLGEIFKRFCIGK